VEILTDENIRGTTLERLYADGHDVLEMKLLAPGDSDEDVLARAVASNRLLITADKDYGELVFRQRLASAGVLLLRTPKVGPEERAELVSRILRELGERLVGQFTVVTPRSTRVRDFPGDASD
jgi:predicted nuclease of predicted toxin-antitoxin system